MALLVFVVVVWLYFFFVLNSVITTATHFIIPNSKLSNHVLLFSCTDKGKIKIPKEDLALSAEDGKYLLCLHANLLFFYVLCLLVKDFRNQELCYPFKFD